MHWYFTFDEDYLFGCESFLTSKNSVNSLHFGLNKVFYVTSKGFNDNAFKKLLYWSNYSMKYSFLDY